MFADDTYKTATGRSSGDIEPKLKSDLEALLYTEQISEFLIGQWRMHK